MLCMMVAIFGLANLSTCPSTPVAVRVAVVVNQDASISDVYATSRGDAEREILRLCKPGCVIVLCNQINEDEALDNSHACRKSKPVS